MDLFEELRVVAHRQSEEADFPGWLLADVLDIAGDPRRFADRTDLVRLLVTQIADFDCYAGAGCFDSSVSADTIGATIRKIISLENRDTSGPVPPSAVSPRASDSGTIFVAVEQTYRGAAMACEIMECCQFFKDNMKNLPKTAEYVMNKLCLGDHEKCNRYRTFKELDEDDLPSDLDPNDAEEVKKVMLCLRSKQLPKE